jgi:hypothetical protein
MFVGVSNEPYEQTFDEETMGIDVGVSVRRAREKNAREGLRFSRKVIAGEEEVVKSDCAVLDVDSIILKCVHPALVMLKDSDECRPRKSVRLTLLLEMLNGDNTTRRG